MFIIDVRGGEAMNNRDEELNIINTILGYCASGETHLEPETMLNPVSHYTDAKRLNQEIETLFRKFPIIVGHAEQIREAGQFFTHNDTGIPILVTRDKTGRINAFINVCRHRGAIVEKQTCGIANTFSCPYHNWTYGLDGNLRGLRQAAGFGKLDKESHGLVKLPVFEQFGLIWVRPSPSEEMIDIEAWLAPMAGQLRTLNIESHTIYREWSLHRNMHWRIALEGFQENYHFCSAHEHTACASYLDNQSIFLNKYPHFRHAVPISKITDLTIKGATPEDYRPNFMTQNYIFPCNFVQVMTDHVYIHTIIPTSQDSCIFKCMMLIPEPAVSEKSRKYWEANYNVVKKVFDEDFEIGESIQKAFSARANANFTFGRYEAGLQLAQKAIDDALEGKLSCYAPPP